MKVIEHGNTYKRYKCPKCHCLFEASDSDTETLADGGILHKATKRETFIECPECGKNILIKKELL